MRCLALLPLFLVAACAQPFEGRVASRLAEAGLPRPVADCMAGRWVERLSLLQLRKISSLADTLRGERGRLTIVRFVAKARQIDDPEIVEVVTRSSIACALSS